MVLATRNRRRRAAGNANAPVLLTNVVELEGNPYLGLWNSAVQDAGGRVAWLGPRSVLRAAPPRWVHLQWPERALNSDARSTATRKVARLLLSVGVARLRGARVVLTMHNLWSHDDPHPLLERVLWFALAQLTTDLHLLSGAGTGEVVARHPRLADKRRHLIPHGNYRPVFAADLPSRAAARRTLGLPLEERVLVTFGNLRRYKGVEALLAALASADTEDLHLLLAGRSDDRALREQIDVAARADRRLRPFSHFLSDDELVLLVRAADEVVLPYSGVLNSGSALLALTLGRPVLLPRTPTFEDLAARVGDAWVRLYDPPLRGSDLVRIGREPAGEPDLGWCDWSVVADGLRALLHG
jgi:beta-1,4-mannosyltransferase